MVADGERLFPRNEVYLIDYGYDVVKKKRIVLAEYAQKRYHQFNRPDFAFIKSWMGVPLLIEDEPIGMIAVDSGAEGLSESGIWKL